MIPKQSLIEVPLLKTLVELGGESPPKDVYPRVRLFFPDMTDDESLETIPSGANRFINNIQWTRQRLVYLGQMTGPKPGIWAITEKGRERVKTTPLVPTDSDDSSKVAKKMPEPRKPSLVEMYEEYEEAFRQKLLGSLFDLAPVEFERFAGGLLRVYGFTKVVVTKVSGDGGIDGHGKLKVGLATMNVAFQCKRWQGNVPRPEIDAFRGAIQGEYEQGLFFTTSEFTEGAKDASIKQGAVPVILLDGRAIVDTLWSKDAADGLI